MKEVKKTLILWSISFVVTSCLFSFAAQAQDGNSEISDSTGTNTYIFLSEKSTIVQTGGIAGVHWSYSIEGLLQLTLDPNAGTALFAHVDANATDDSPLQHTLDPNEVFNMTSLAGTFIDDTTISFMGKAKDGSDVSITVTIEDDLIYLAGETIPPPNSADFFLFSLDAVAQRKYSGGTGEPNNPYRIATAEDLMLIGESPEDYDKHFILTADIDLDPDLPGRKVFDKAVIGPATEDELWFEGIPFTGIFNGNGKKIFNFNCVSIDTNYTGLFGCAGTYKNEAIIKDLGLIDPNVDAGTGNNVGSLVGILEKGTITNCYVEGGNIAGGNNVGGLVGAYGEVVQRIHVDPPFTISNCYSTSSVKGELLVGGLVGANYIGRITNSYAMGIVLGQESVGGLVGQNGKMVEYINFQPIQGTIFNCYSTELVSGQSDVGGLVGLNVAGTVIGCFWDVETSGQITSDGGTGKTTAEMQTASTFLEAGWDFVGETENGTEDIWWIDEGKDYPGLWWEPLERSTDDMLFLVVDDFESYSDLIAWPDFKSIFDVWIDGFDNPENGAIVGYFDHPFCEQTIVHNGNQSMPFFYDNSGPADYSEATAKINNLEIGRDWTIEGVVILSLWFYGDPNNTPEPMYVALNGSDTTFYDNQNALLIEDWTEWRIDLEEFASQGADLTNINTISIGFDNRNNPQSGGSGLVFFDDIRLYRLKQ